MTFGRWLLTHSFSIFLVSVLILGYVYRKDLQLEQAYQQLLNLEQPATVINALKPQKPVAEQTQNAVAEAEKPRQAPVIPATNSSTPELLATTAAVIPTISEPLMMQDDLLMDARQAYWDRDYEKAIYYYRQLMDRDPENPDYSGELGNIFYALNDYNSASQLYFRSAQLLSNQGQRDSALQLISPVTAMNRELGDKLKQSLMH